MSRPDVQKGEKEISLEVIIDNIRMVRNERIKTLLNDQNLIVRYKELFGTALSTIKCEFIKRDLKALLITPVDLVYYAGVINQIHESKVLEFQESDSTIFDREVEAILNKYRY